jgi:hypothetical protein
MLQRLGPDAVHVRSMSERVYSTLVERAARVLPQWAQRHRGRVYARPMGAHSHRAGCPSLSPFPFTGIWLEAPESLLMIANGNSDATMRRHAGPEIVEHCSADWTRATSHGVVSMPQCGIRPCCRTQSISCTWLMSHATRKSPHQPAHEITSGRPRFCMTRMKPPVATLLLRKTTNH